jgi:PAS domain S-box-containing protein
MKHSAANETTYNRWDSRAVDLSLMNEKTVDQLVGELRASEDARRRADDALHQSEIRFRELVEQSLGLICTHDLDGVLLSINPAAAHALGYDPQEGVGVNLQEFLSPNTRYLFDKYLQRIRENRIDTGLMRVVRKDGAERVWMYRNVRITDTDAPPHVVGHAIDVTERIEAEEALRASEQNLKRAHEELERRVHERTAQLREANDRLRAEAEIRQQAERDRVELLEREHQAREEAEAANRLKDDFLAAVSHELRTPLTVILGWVHLAKDGKVSADRYHELLLRIGRNAETLARLVNDLLDLSRLISGRYTLDLSKVVLEELLETTLDSFRTSADAKGVAIATRFPPHSVPVYADAMRLQQIVGNLLSNAIKYTPGGGTVWLSARRVADNIEITMRDSGEGIAADFLPHVFEPFRQASAGTTRADTGLGLGLAIVKHLVDLHGGTIRAESDGPGQGATFVVELPVARVTHVADGAERTEPALGAEWLDGLHVLVVEDDRECRELVQIILEKAGARITAVSSAREALDALRVSRPDALVSDIGMQNEDGFALISKVRNLSSLVANIPALALTGYAQLANDALLPGRFQKIALKPIDPRQLVGTVASLVSEWRQSQSL